MGVIVRIPPTVALPKGWKTPFNLDDPIIRSDVFDSELADIPVVNAEPEYADNSDQANSSSGNESSSNHGDDEGEYDCLDI